MLLTNILGKLFVAYCKSWNSRWGNHGS